MGGPGAQEYLINVAEDGLLDAVVLHNLAQHAAVAAADDEHPLGVRVRVHGEVGDHLLVGELVALGALDDVVEDEDAAVVGRLEDEHVLVLALLVVEDLLDAEGHGLAGPHLGDFAEPPIWELAWLARVPKHRLSWRCISDALRAAPGCVGDGAARVPWRRGRM